MVHAEWWTVWSKTTFVAFDPMNKMIGTFYCLEQNLHTTLHSSKILVSQRSKSIWDGSQRVNMKLCYHRQLVWSLYLIFVSDWKPWWMTLDMQINLPDQGNLQKQVFITSDLPIARVILCGYLKSCSRTPTAMRSNLQSYRHEGMILSRSWTLLEEMHIV